MTYRSGLTAGGRTLPTAETPIPSDAPVIQYRPAGTNTVRRYRPSDAVITCMQSTSCNRLSPLCQGGAGNGRRKANSARNLPMQGCQTRSRYLKDDPTRRKRFAPFGVLVCCGPWFSEPDSPRSLRAGRDDHGTACR